jgi:hypothetical protein
MGLMVMDGQHERFAFENRENRGEVIAVHLLAMDDIRPELPDLSNYFNNILVTTPLAKGVTAKVPDPQRFHITRKRYQFRFGILPVKTQQHLVLA